MGSFDIYCAICGGPFVAVKIEELSGAARRQLQREFAALLTLDRNDKQEKPIIKEPVGPLISTHGVPVMTMAEHTPHVLDGFDFNSFLHEPDSGDLGVASEIQGHEHQPIGDSAQDRPAEACASSPSQDDDEDDESEDISTLREYDSQVISEEETEWISTLHVLGIDGVDEDGRVIEGGDEYDRAFVSGPGHYQWFGAVVVPPGDGPYFPVDSELSCYTWAEGKPSYPFHWCCYELLSRCLTGTPDVTNLEKGNLFKAMEECQGRAETCLDLDYDNFHHGFDQYWEEEPGQEYLVAHPTERPGLVDVVHDIVTTNNFKLSSGADLWPHVKHDPFKVLPYDLLHDISAFLPPESVLNLSRASWPVHVALRASNSLWKSRIVDQMPWFFELQALIDDKDDLLRGKDFKGLFLWADKVTKPRLGMAGPFITLGNRRRIWRACEQLKVVYESAEVRGPATYS